MISSLTTHWPTQPRRALPASAAHLYFMRLDGFAEPPPVLYALLDQAERERCTRYLFMRNRIECTAARALARAALSRYADVDPRAWTFTKGEHGKPQLIVPPGAPPLHFNVAHTPGLVVCVIARGREVGVDAESLGRSNDIALLARRVLSAAEQQALWALPETAQARRFLIHWTLKEAYLKARGIGIGLPLAEITLLADDDPDSLAGPPTHFALGTGVGDTPARWQIERCHLTPGHVAAVAIERTHEDVTIHVEEVVP